MKITWLHLTDLHRGMTPQKWLWPTLEQSFFTDLAALHETHGPIDLILFSGDFVQSGSAKEFEQLNKTLKRLYAHLKKLGSNPLLLGVPGNHDLVRPKSTKPEVQILADWVQKNEVRDEFWKTDKCPYRRLVASAFKPYTKWLQTHPFPKTAVKSGILPGDFSTNFKKEGIKLGIVGLNSAFLQLTGGDFRNKLALHPRQIAATCGEEFSDWFHENHLSILLTHQSPEWLNPESRGYLDGEIAPSGRFALHMFGHMHESKLSSISEGGGSSRILLQGYSLFGLEFCGDKQRRSHGFSLGTLTFTEDSMSAVLRIWPRKAEKHQEGHYHLVADSSFTLLPDGGTKPQSIPLIHPITTSTISDFGKFVNPIVTRCVPKEIQEKITLLILSALSVEREERRQIHTTILRAPESVRSSFLKCMMMLTKCSAARVRGEAYYCVGGIRLRPEKPTVTEEFLKAGLRDSSLFVQACCANVLSRFCPLSLSTVSMLEAMSIEIEGRASSPEKRTLIYYVKRTLEIDTEIKSLKRNL